MGIKSAIAVVFILTCLYSALRLYWDDEMPNWIGY